MNWLDFLDRGRTASFRSTSNRNTTFVTIASRPTARGRPPQTPPREARPPWPPPAWPHTTGTAPASCTNTRAGTRLDTPGTAPGRSRSHRGRNPGTVVPARRRSRARTRTGARSAPPTAPSPRRNGSRQDGTGVSREGSAAGTGHQALRTGRRSVPSAAWRDLSSMPSFWSKGKGVPEPANSIALATRTTMS